MNLVKKNKNIWSITALTSIGLVSVGYILGGSNFAEIHLQLSFLNFPIFIGEFLFFLCLIALVGVFISKEKTLLGRHKWSRLLWVYVTIVIIKALYGYFIWGPLALRHAALFYYPLFALFGYCFFEKRFINQKVGVVLCSFIIYLMTCPAFNPYWLLTCFLLVCILIKHFSWKIWKVLFLVLLLGVTPIRYFFNAARMMMVSNFVAILFLVFFMPFIFLKKRVFRALIICFGIFFLVFGFAQLSDRNALISILNTDKIFDGFKEYDLQVKREIKQFERSKSGKVILYNSNRKILEENKNQIIENARRDLIFAFKQSLEKNHNFDEKNILKNKDNVLLIKEIVQRIPSIKVEERVRQKYKEWGIDEIRETWEEIVLEETMNQGVKISKSEIKEILDLVFVVKKDVLAVEKKTGRSLEGAHANTLFRLFIWRDMLVELLTKKPILGFSFGKPLRSISLEILNWGTANWSLDGWVPAHNSYLHILYRLGIAGIAFISVTFFFLLKMIKDFVLMKSLIGIFLCAIIIDWFVAANFLLILELPYTAIPIWTIFGMAWSYCKDLKENKIYSENSCCS